jgi:DNA-directed RNA polymerase specialized sigma24 family protein
MSDTQREEHLLITSDEFALAERTARLVAPKWSGVDVDDVIAALYLWLVENHGYVVAYRSEPHGTAKLVTALTREAHAACAKEYRHAHHLADQTWYSAQQLERLLPHAWDAASWPQASVYHHSEHNSSATESVLVMLGDVAAGLARLPAEDRRLLAARYRDDASYAEIATDLGISSEAARKRCSRALDRLHHLLGGDKVDPPSRWSGSQPDA